MPNRVSLKSKSREYRRRKRFRLKNPRINKINKKFKQRRIRSNLKSNLKKQRIKLTIKHLKTKQKLNRNNNNKLNKMNKGCKNKNKCLINKPNMMQNKKINRLKRLICKRL